MYLKTFLSLLIIAAYLPFPADAESGQYERSLNIQKNIMSPFCPGQLLYNCPTEQATDLKDQIEQDLASGKSEEEVIDAIQAKYPSAAYGAPRPKGLGLYVWLIPGFFLISLIGGILLWFRKQKANSNLGN